MHPIHHSEFPPIHLALNEVLFDEEYSTPSIVEARQ